MDVNVKTLAMALKTLSYFLLQTLSLIKMNYNLVYNFYSFACWLVIQWLLLVLFNIIKIKENILCTFL